MGSYQKKNSHTILIIKYSKQKKFNFDELTWFPHCPTEKKRKIIKISTQNLKKFKVLISYYLEPRSTESF